MNHLNNLRIYQHARSVCADAYRLAAQVTDAALRDQIRRAATSVVLNIAEGRGRRTDADFARFLTIARGSNTELDAQLAFAANVGLLDQTITNNLRDNISLCGRMLSALINRLRSG